MTNLDTRTVNRDSLFLMAKVRLSGASEATQLKVRNLSPGGMMAEGRMKVSRGAGVEVELRNHGWVSGRVAWTHGDRFGISFQDEIDAAAAREVNKSTGFEEAAIIPRRPTSAALPTDPGKIRAI